MCCFSGEVNNVSKTNIFTRIRGGNQIVVYSMNLDTPQDVAMILPIPIKPDTKSVDFIDLSSFPEFFDRMNAVFPNMMKGMRGADSFIIGADNDSLEVVQVGAFEASFVPNIKSFARADRRFALSNDVWSKLPQYADFGFVVFKLRKGAGKVHPMAFEFETRDKTSLFFPTVHIHDGKVHKEDFFDHKLFIQGNTNIRAWETATIDRFDDRAQGLVIKGPIQRKVMSGMYANKDVIIPIMSSAVDVARPTTKSSQNAPVVSSIVKRLLKQMTANG